MQVILLSCVCRVVAVGYGADINVDYLKVFACGKEENVFSTDDLTQVTAVLARKGKEGKTRVPIKSSNL